LQAISGFARFLVPRRFVTVGAITGSTLIALSLVGSPGTPANISQLADSHSTSAYAHFHALGKAAFTEGRYEDARAACWFAATLAMREGFPRNAAMDWSNAGFFCVAAMEFEPARDDLTLGKTTRAWIGAGASAAISSEWDFPDDASQFRMVRFYSALRNSPDGNSATALREARVAALHSDGPANQPSRWAGYFLLSRI